MMDEININETGFFPYGEKEIAYLKKKDKRLGEIIDLLGHPNRPLDEDLFSSVVHHIIGQQISTKAQLTIWTRMMERFGDVTPQAVCDVEISELQGMGMTFKKAEYIHEFSEKIMKGEFNLEAVSQMNDAEAIDALSSLKGIGVWTAEMILLHCLKRQNVLSYGDLAILRGMRMVYHHKKIDKKLFEKYRKRYSPYGSIASIFLWKVSSGAVPNLVDPASTASKKSSSKNARSQTTV